MTTDEILALLLAILTACGFVLFRFRRWLIGKLSSQGYLLLLGFIVSSCVPMLGWIVGLSSLVNDPVNPVINGTGGFYGTNVHYFPAAVAVYLGLNGLAIGACLLMPKLQLRHKSGDLLKEIGRNLNIERLAYVLLGFTFALTVYFFFAVGWDRLWHSDLARFEFETNAATGPISPNLALTMLLALGCAAASLAYFPGIFLLSTVSAFIAVLPFVAFASRGLTMVATAYVVAIFYRVKPSWRWLCALPCLFIVYFSLRLPLLMRAQDQTGLRVALECLTNTNDANGSVSDDLAGVFLNVGQGFGLMVEERETNASGKQIIEGIPATYFLLSISPTVSAIDGFATNWVDYNPRQNAYTPFSGLCELISLNFWIGIIFPPFVLALSVLFCRRMSGTSTIIDTVLYGFVFIVVLGFLQFQQYPLRTATRYWYSAYALFGLCYLAGRFADKYAAGQAIFATFARARRR